jgi:hypothetical protein
VNPPAIFTMARIAQELGRSRQYVYLCFAGVRSIGEVLVRGQRTAGWLPASFPKTIFDELEAIRVRKHFRSIADLLSAPPSRWMPAFPFVQAAPEEQQGALRLQLALTPFLAQWNGAGTSSDAFTRHGIAEFHRILGYKIGARRWRDIFMRTIERDGGRGEWHRPELFLREKPARISVERPIAQTRESRLEILEDALAIVLPKVPLDTERKDYLWNKVGDQLQLSIAQGENARKTKRAILAALLASGLFGASKETIRRNFDHNRRKYLTSGGKVIDGRRVRDQRKPLPDHDKEKIVARALDCGGRTRQAFRELRDAGDLSEETLSRTITNPRSKSYMPASFSRAVGPEVNRLMPLHRGEREFALRGPYVPQDYSQLAAGQAYQLDDITLPIVFWDHDPEAPGGIFFGRGQWILAIDVRSLRALGHALHSAKVYNMRIVRSLLLHVHDGFGLPESLILERGMWRTAKIIKGDELDMTHTEQGLREFGVTFHHRTKPRGKIIERVIGLVQNRMERLPGYVGRNERTDKQERVQEQILAVQSGREHPSKFFLSKAQFLQELDALLSDYNSEPQDGRLSGHSPAETWNANLLPQGTVQLGEKARYLLAHHRRPVRVQRSGIRLPASLGGGLYYDANSGRFAGQQMLAWINPEQLNAITLTSLDRREGPYIVERAKPLAPIGATDTELAKANEQIAAHNDYSRTQYRVIQPHLARRNFRRLWHVDHATVELGEQMAAENAAVIATRQKENLKVQRAKRAVRELGLKINVDHRNPSRAVAAVELMREAYEEHDGSASDE